MVGPEKLDGKLARGNHQAINQSSRYQPRIASTTDDHSPKASSTALNRLLKTNTNPPYHCDGLSSTASTKYRRLADTDGVFSMATKFTCSSVHQRDVIFFFLLYACQETTQPSVVVLSFTLNGPSLEGRFSPLLSIILSVGGNDYIAAHLVTLRCTLPSTLIINVTHSMQYLYVWICSSMRNNY